MSGPGGVESGLADLLDDLTAEERELQTLLHSIDDDAWLRPTPARGWDVRDTISHLADTDEMAIATATGIPGSINGRAAIAASGEDLTYRGVLHGRRLGGPGVLEWWEESTHALRLMFEALDPNLRVPWGIGMRGPSLVTARLMETWAHGLDVYTAVGIAPTDTDRLAHVAWLATRALPYAYTFAGREPPAEPVRVELTLPSGAPWNTGPVDAVNRITGTASEYCRVFVHRMKVADARSLRADGPAATDALSVARAFL